jgi:hypothetical protein
MMDLYTVAIASCRPSHPAALSFAVYRAAAESMRTAVFYILSLCVHQQQGSVQNCDEGERSIQPVLSYVERTQYKPAIQ